MAALVGSALLSTPGPVRSEIEIPATAAGEQPGEAGKPDAGEKYLRFVEREDGSGGLDTANATFFREADGVRVDLLSVIHIADKDYFEKFNRMFPNYERVLFELVGDPEGLRQYQSGGERRRGVGLSGIQAAAADALDLSFQMDVVDYSAENLVHADMDDAVFRERQRERGQGFLQMYLKAVRMSMTNPRMSQSSIGLLDLAEAMVSDERSTRLKWLIAGEFSNADEFLAMLEADGGTVIIGERNKVAIEVLQERIATGDRKLAIFYGGGHMQDFEERLVALGFELQGKEWWTAWSLSAPAVIEVAEPEPEQR